MELLIAVVGAVVVAFVFFVRDQVFALPRLSGVWLLRTVVEESAYKPYHNMELRYVLALWLEGPVVRGTAEKVWERTESGEHEYVGDKRVRLSVSGYVTKKYFRRDELVLHLEEHGRERDSSQIHSLAIDGKTRAHGRFFSTAANTSGTSLLTMGLGKWHIGG